MTMRRMMFGLACAAALSGTARAEGPRNALPEGRELDPVAREHYLTTPDDTDDSAPGRSAERSGDHFSSVLLAVAETLMRELTIPLGTVKPASGHR